MKHSNKNTSYTLRELEELWEQLGDVYFNDCVELEQSWYRFPKGTERYEIWHWFEDQHEDFSVAKMLGIN